MRPSAANKKYVSVSFSEPSKCSDLTLEEREPIRSRMRLTTPWAWAPLAVCILLAGAGAASALNSIPDLVQDGPIEGLKPGEYLWAPNLAPSGPVTVIISLKAQRAYVYRNGMPIGVSTVSTGKRGHATPTGVFTILQKHIKHSSSLYNDAPMPFMQRLTWDGIAMHAGHLPGYPASHGCVRMPKAFAEKLYEITKVGLTVVITDEALVPEVAPSPLVLDTAPADGQPAPGTFSWTPEKSASGPISIVVSGPDRRMVVLRNGVVIGSSDILIDDPVTATEAFTLRAIDGAGFHWMRLPLPGQIHPKAGDMTADERARGHLPEAFRRDVGGILAAGTTLLITRDSMRTSGVGTRLIVIESRAK